MDRRTFLGALASAFLAAPLAGEAQPAGKVYRIGWIGIAPSPTNDPLREAFIGGMRLPLSYCSRLPPLQPVRPG